MGAWRQLRNVEFYNLYASFFLGGGGGGLLLKPVGRKWR